MSNEKYFVIFKYSIELKGFDVDRKRTTISVYSLEKKNRKEIENKAAEGSDIGGCINSQFDRRKKLQTP